MISLLLVTRLLAFAEIMYREIRCRLWFSLSRVFSRLAVVCFPALSCYVFPALSCYVFSRVQLLRVFPRLAVRCFPAFSCYVFSRLSCYVFSRVQLLRVFSALSCCVFSRTQLSRAFLRLAVTCFPAFGFYVFSRLFRVGCFCFEFWLVIHPSITDLDKSGCMVCLIRPLHVVFSFLGSKMVPFWSWLQMGKDLLLINLRYLVGAWRIEPMKLKSQ